MPNLAVPSPSTLAPGQLVAGAVWNAQVRDAINFMLNPPIFAATQNAAPAAWTGWAAMGLQSIIVDSYSGYATATPTRYTAQVPGWYDAAGVVSFSNANTTGFRSCCIGVNGTRTIGSAQDAAAGPDFTTVASKPVQVFLNVGDYIELFGFTNVSITTQVTLADLATRLDVRWVHQ